MKGRLVAPLRDKAASFGVPGPRGLACGASLLDGDSLPRHAAPAAHAAEGREI